LLGEHAAEVDRHRDFGRRRAALAEVVAGVAEGSRGLAVVPAALRDRPAADAGDCRAEFARVLVAQGGNRGLRLLLELLRAVEIAFRQERGLPVEEALDEFLRALVVLGGASRGG
jgi:hypothetical protein